MPTQRELYLTRGMRGHCPRCDGKSVFKSRYRLHSHCPDCGLPLEHEDGWSLGAIPLNYTIACVFWILPVGIVFMFGWLSLTAALVLAGLGAVVLPILTYRFSKALWIGIYYAVLPHEVARQPDKEKGASG
jgi:uncharacterized protein (DUF983 family)